MVRHKTVCLRRLGGNRGGELRAGRFFANPQVSPARIIDSWSETTASAVVGRHVLAIQDTTVLSFATGDEARTAPRRTRRTASSQTRRRGLGPINDGTAYGLLAHVMLAVDAADGACLGLLGGTVWNRPGFVASPEWARPLAERESRRWVDTAEAVRPVLAAAAMVTVVSDREGDMYPLWARVPGATWHALGRVDRKLADSSMLFATADRLPRSERRTLTLPARAPAQAARAARVELRFGPVAIRRSPNEKDRQLAKAVPLTVIDVREGDPPAGAEAIHWRLLTTHAVSGATEAWQIVAWYQRRWCIEQLFRVLKAQGLRLEDSQMASATGLAKLTAAAIKAACAVLQLVQERDGAHAQPASHLLSPAEIDTAEALTPTLEGRTARQTNPHPPATLARVSWVVARLGGWNCYGKPPGPITMQNGLQRFAAIHQGRMLSRLTE